MLTLVHLYLGTLAVLTNIIAALWLFLLDRQQRPLHRWSSFALFTARGTLALQVIVGLGLIGRGGVGRQLHYLLAIAAIVVTWVTYTRSRRAGAQHALRTLALGCAASSLLTLGAYLSGQG